MKTTGEGKQSKYRLRVYILYTVVWMRMYAKQWVGAITMTSVCIKLHIIVIRILINITFVFLEHSPSLCLSGTLSLSFARYFMIIIISAPNTKIWSQFVHCTQIQYVCTLSQLVHTRRIASGWCFDTQIVGKILLVIRTCHSGFGIMLWLTSYNTIGSSGFEKAWSVWFLLFGTHVDGRSHFNLFIFNSLWRLVVATSVRSGDIFIRMFGCL